MITLRTRACSARPLGSLFAMALLVASLAPALVTAHPGREHGNVIANADGDNVRLRSGPGYDDEEITRFPEGTGVDIIDGPYDAGDGSSWYQVDVDGLVGYMVSDYLVAIEAAAPEPVPEETTGSSVTRTSGLAKTNDSVYLRAGPSTADAVIRTLEAGEEVTLTGGSRNGWMSVSATGGDGWVSSQYLAFPNAPIATRYTIDTVHLRTGPGTSYDSITYLDVGVPLELTGSVDGGFAQLTSPFGTGWVAAQYIGANALETPEAPGAPATPAIPDTAEAPAAPETPVEPEPRFATANVNLRSAAGQASTVLTVIASGTEVAFLGETAEGFAQVRTVAGDGWIAAEYLSDIRPEAPSGPDPAPAPAPSDHLVAWPVSGGEWVISQGYNGSSHQNRTQYWQYFYSFDLKRSDGSTAGQPISSAVNGTVRWIDEATGGMSISMGGGLAYAFFHARLDPGISEGDTVTQGQYLGTIAPAGEAANGSSAHLHITIWETDDEGNWSRRAIPFTGRVAIEGESFPATGAGNDYRGYTFTP